MKVQWQVGREEQRVEWSSSERRVMGAVRKLSWKIAQVITALGAKY